MTLAASPFGGAAYGARLWFGVKLGKYIYPPLVSRAKYVFPFSYAVSILDSIFPASFVSSRTISVQSSRYIEHLISDTRTHYIEAANILNTINAPTRDVPTLYGAQIPITRLTALARNNSMSCYRTRYAFNTSGVIQVSRSYHFTGGAGVTFLTSNNLLNTLSAGSVKKTLVAKHGGLLLLIVQKVYSITSSGIRKYSVIPPKRDHSYVRHKER